MLLRHIPSKDLVDALDMREVFDPFVKSIAARTQAGEDTMDVDFIAKSALVFPSGESLPLCWLDSHYREHVSA